MKESTRYEKIDGAAFEEMFSQYLPIVYSMQSRYSIRDFDFDDWLQEGRIALNDALQSYCKGRGTTFGLYYKMIFENRIRSLLRRQQAQKRFDQQQAVSMDKADMEAFDEHFQYHEYMEENRSLYYYLKGEEPSTIAQLLNESEKAIRNALNRAKNKLKKKLYDLDE